MQRLFWFLMLVSLTAGSCEERCRSEKTGELNLDAASEVYVPLVADTDLIFSNGADSTLVMQLDVQQVFNNRNCVEYTCEAFSDPFAPVDCKYYETESIRHLYSLPGDTLLIDLTLAIMNYENETTLFYDYLRVVMSGVGQLAFGEYVTAVRFSDPVYDPNQINLLDELVLDEEVMLNGITFSDVLRTNDNEPATVWVAAGSGLVAFERDGVIWTLVR